jgi:hypothetical protein
MLGDNSTVDTPLDVTSCNGTPAQWFWSHDFAFQLDLPAPNPRKLGFVRDHVAPALDPVDALRPAGPLR